MYPEDLIAPMRHVFAAAGFIETKTAEDVTANINQKGTTFDVVNSVCGCAVGSVRPGVRTAVAGSVKLQFKEKLSGWPHCAFSALIALF